MYAIQNEFDEMYLAEVRLNQHKGIREELRDWTGDEQFALRFENEEEAQAVIDFIGNVMDWELAEDLEVVFID